MGAIAKRALFATLAVLAAGCTKGSFDPNLAVEKRELGEIFDCYMSYLKANEKPPTQLADFEERDALYANVLRTVRDGKYKIVWGVNKKDAGTILAYEPRAAEESGVVLMADGTVKSMTAAQFKSAKPAP